MNYDKYENIYTSTDRHEFKFVSTGTKGNLEKLVQYTPFDDDKNIYNLALGTILADGSIDYKTLSKNGDRNKILATIASTAYIFSESFPDKKIFLSGDIPAKTRLYQMAINDSYHELCENFKIQAYKPIKENGIVVEYELEELKKGTNYDAFLFTKNNKE
ncbi:DUF6934 family protein [Pedobacter sp. N23S346]|uniref:DUF6934 family protein n=1 Tax=Pedobacter sp. N23S346 TaxID=3402750 RepID=UPI003AC5BE27